MRKGKGDIITYLPRVTQRNHVINVEITSRGPGSAVVRRNPCTTGSGTSAVYDNGGGVALEHVFAGVTGAGDGNPLGEENESVSFR